MKGKFIVFEGIDGSGSSTQVNLTLNYLRNLGFDVIPTREPGGTPFAEDLRDLLLSLKERADLAELLIFEADRADHVNRVIIPNLELGRVVLSDRYEESTIAYQAFGKGLDLEMVARLNTMTTGGLRSDLTLFYDVFTHEATPTEINYFERLGEGFQRRARDGYLYLAGLEPERIKVVKRIKAETIDKSIRRTFEEGTLPHIREILSL